MKFRWIKFIASFISFTFVVTSLTPISFANAPELPVSPFRTLEIPAEFGQVTDSLVGDPSAPAFIHIQSAHGNYMAEKNIQKLLEYIEQHSKIHLMLLEGAANRLQPQLFHMFPAIPDFNRKVTDKLMQEGYLTGPENFLIESSKHSEGWGIEDLAAYRKDRDSFIKVVKADRVAKTSLREFRSALEKRFTTRLNKDLLALVRQEGALDAGTLSYEGWLKLLGEASKKHLKMDLADAFYQDEYPFLVRFFRLQAIGAKIDREKAHQEAEFFLKDLETRKIPQDILSSFQRLLRTPEAELLRKDNGSDNDLSLRRAFDRVFEKLPKDFSMSAWPHWTLYAQYIILMQEMEAKGFHEEALRLKERIQDALAKTEVEKEYVGLARDLRSLKRLFELELTRGEFETLLARNISVDSFLAAVNGKRGGVKASPELRALFAAAVAFYKTAVLREAHMFQNALKKMRELKENRAVIVTGGFHTDGLKRLAAGQNCSYLQITPRVADVTKRDHEIYLRSILGTREFETSQMSPWLGSDVDAMKVVLGARVQDWFSNVGRLIRDMISLEPVTVQPSLSAAFANSIFGLSTPALTPAQARSEVRSKYFLEGVTGQEDEAALNRVVAANIDAVTDAIGTGVRSYFDAQVLKRRFPAFPQKSYDMVMVSVREWLLHPSLDQYTKRGILRAVEEGRWQDIATAHGDPVIFGTAGVRGPAALTTWELEELEDKGFHAEILKGPGTVNNVTMAKLTTGVARYYRSVGRDKVSITYDSRVYGKALADFVAAIFLHEGLQVYLFDETAPMPEMSYSVAKLKLDLGILISASHNPPESQGYKVANEKGAQLDPVTRDGVMDFVFGLPRDGKDLKPGKEEISAVSTEDVKWILEASSKLKNPLEVYNLPEGEILGPLVRQELAKVSKDRLIILGDKDIEADKEGLRHVDIHNLHADHVKSLVLRPGVVAEQAPSMRRITSPMYGNSRKADQRIAVERLGFKNTAVVQEFDFFHQGQPGSRKSLFRHLLYRMVDGKQNSIIPDPGNSAGHALAWEAVMEDYLAQVKGELTAQRGQEPSDDEVIVVALKALGAMDGKDPDSDRLGVDAIVREEELPPVLAGLDKLPPLSTGKIKNLKTLSAAEQDHIIARVGQLIFFVVPKHLRKEVGFSALKLLSANDTWAILMKYRIDRLIEMMRGQTLDGQALPAGTKSVPKGLKYTIVKTHVTTDALTRVADYARSQGMEVETVEPYVGFTLVAELILRGWEEGKINLGGAEESGGFSVGGAPPVFYALMHLFQKHANLKVKITEDGEIDSTVQDPLLSLDQDSYYGYSAEELRKTLEFLKEQGMVTQDAEGRYALAGAYQDLRGDHEAYWGSQQAGKRSLREWAGFAPGERLGKRGHTLEKDGLLASVLMLEVSAYAKSHGKTLNQFIQEELYLNPTIGYFATTNQALEFENSLAGKQDKIRVLQNALQMARDFKDGRELIINGRKVTGVKIFIPKTQKYKDPVNFPARPTKDHPGYGDLIPLIGGDGEQYLKANPEKILSFFPEEGVRFYFNDSPDDHLTIRPSGTENKIRFYVQWTARVKEAVRSQVEALQRLMRDMLTADSEAVKVALNAQDVVSSARSEVRSLDPKNFIYHLKQQPGAIYQAEGHDGFSEEWPQSVRFDVGASRSFVFSRYDYQPRSTRAEKLPRSNFHLYVGEAPYNEDRGALFEMFQNPTVGFYFNPEGQATPRWSEAKAGQPSVVLEEQPFRISKDSEAVQGFEYANPLSLVIHVKPEALQEISSKYGKLGFEIATPDKRNIRVDFVEARSEARSMKDLGVTLAAIEGQVAFHNSNAIENLRVVYNPQDRKLGFSLNWPNQETYARYPKVVVYAGHFGVEGPQPLEARESGREGLVSRYEVVIPSNVNATGFTLNIAEKPLSDFSTPLPIWLGYNFSLVTPRQVVGEPAFKGFSPQVYKKGSTYRFIVNIDSAAEVQSPVEQLRGYARYRMPGEYGWRNMAARLITTDVEAGKRIFEVAFDRRGPLPEALTFAYTYLGRVLAPTDHEDVFPNKLQGYELVEERVNASLQDLGVKFSVAGERFHRVVLNPDRTMTLRLQWPNAAVKALYEHQVTVEHGEFGITGTEEAEARILREESLSTVYQVFFPRPWHNYGVRDFTVFMKGAFQNFGISNSEPVWLGTNYSVVTEEQMAQEPVFGGFDEHLQLQSNGSYLFAVRVKTKPDVRPAPVSVYVYYGGAMREAESVAWPRNEGTLVYKIDFGQKVPEKVRLGYTWFGPTFPGQDRWAKPSEVAAVTAAHMTGEIAVRRSEAREAIIQQLKEKGVTIEAYRGDWQLGGHTNELSFTYPKGFQKATGTAGYRALVRFATKGNGHADVLSFQLGNGSILPLVLIGTPEGQDFGSQLIDEVAVPEVRLEVTRLLMESTGKSSAALIDYLIGVVSKFAASKFLSGPVIATEARSEVRTEAVAVNNLSGEYFSLNNIAAKLTTAKEVAGNIVEIGITKLTSFSSVIKRTLFPEHFDASTEIMRGVNIAAARQVLPVKVTESGHAIVVTPGVVEMGLFPVLRAVYQSSDIFVVGADKVQERLIRQMDRRMSGLNLQTVVAFVKDAPAFQEAVATRTMKRGVSRMQISGLSTANDLVLAQTLRTQVPDFILVTAGIFQRFQQYTNVFINNLVTEFQAAISRERSA